MSLSKPPVIDIAHLSCFHLSYTPPIVTDTTSSSTTTTTTVPCAWSSPEHLESLKDAIVHCARQILTSMRTLPSKMTEDGKIYDCPNPTYALPREKPIPVGSAYQSAWEKFAKKKGIQLNRKKDNKVWDENTQDWKAKWGRKARDYEKKYEWAEEVKQTYKPHSIGGDPFLDKKQLRKERVEKAAKNKDKNDRKRDQGKKRSLGSKDSAAISALSKTRDSLVTASMGKFDRTPKKRKLK